MTKRQGGCPIFTYTHNSSNLKKARENEMTIVFLLEMAQIASAAVNLCASV
jgi:hypothetical protein